MFLCWLSAMGQMVVYDYDAAGNRVSRQVAVEQPRSPAPRHRHITEPDASSVPTPTCRHPTTRRTILLNGKQHETFLRLHILPDI